MNLSADSVVIWHHGSVHLRNFFVHGGLLLLLWILYAILQYFLPSLSLLSRVFASVGIIIYLNFVLQFLNNYLDAIVINRQGVSIFDRKKILNYSLRYCHWDHIESINQSQTSLSDRLFDKGDIDITLNHGTKEHFTYIAKPKYVSSLLWEKKSEFESKNYNNSSPEWWFLHNGGGEKFDILVETLWEVIKEYMDKDKWKHDHPDKRNM